MTAVQTEQVMVVPTELFRECGYFQGFNSETEKYLTTLLDPANTQYLPRGDMEEDPSFKQLIPYCIFEHTNDVGEVSVFQYTRGKGQGESRLHSKRSVGIGGHISTLDLGDQSPYEDGMRRELEEEVVISTPYSQSCVGLINDDENEVGKVHLGIVHVFKVEKPDIAAREIDIADAGFMPVEQMLGGDLTFETWSKICIEALYGS